MNPLRVPFSVLDKYCSKDSLLDINGVNQKLFNQSNVFSGNDLVNEFPDIPHSPSFVDVKEMDRMIDESKKLSAFEFYCNVRSYGKWDFKRLGDKKEFENFGNYLFGILAKANGWDDKTRDLIVGIYQLSSGTSKLEWINTTYFGDDPNDHEQIIKGVKNYIDRLIRELDFETKIWNRRGFIFDKVDLPRLREPKLDNDYDNTMVA
jgi:hypothetical protein